MALTRVGETPRLHREEGLGLAIGVAPITPQEPPPSTNTGKGRGGELPPPPPTKPWDLWGGETWEVEGTIAVHPQRRDWGTWYYWNPLSIPMQTYCRGWWQWEWQKLFPSPPQPHQKGGL